ncbi:RICIN domain-containing protein, partial [Streptomyces sioyaensis]|uniref:RICIN domain-containing protein n=1 Tax=Streptomyces sioyaensis TaxID=67364 RepID=UPI0037D7849E
MKVAFRRRLVAGAGTVAAVALGGVMLAPVAQAAAPSPAPGNAGIITLKNTSNGKNLEIDSADLKKDGAKAQQWGYKKGYAVPKNGQWSLKSLRGGAYSIVNVANGKNLEIDSADLKKDGAKAQQWGYKKGYAVPK